MTIGECARIGGQSKKFVIILFIFISAPVDFNNPKRFYCIGKNYSTNQIIVGNKDNLITNIAYLTNINWISGFTPKKLLDVCPI